MYHGQYGIDKIIETNYLEYFDRDGWMIECGAGNGISDNVCLHFEQEYGFKVINVEAEYTLHGKLLENRPKSWNICLALSDYSGITDFVRAIKPNEIPGGSLSYKKNYDKYLISLGYKLQIEKALCNTYDNLTNDLGANKVELFVLDVEGHELNVLHKMTENLPRVICIEYPLSGLYEIKNILEKKEYRFDFVSENNALFSRGIPEREWVGKTSIWQL
jgi:FkbM family methyltransferase